MCFDTQRPHSITSVRRRFTFPLRKQNPIETDCVHDYSKCQQKKKMMMMIIVIVIHNNNSWNRIIYLLYFLPLRSRVVKYCLINHVIFQGPPTHLLKKWLTQMLQIWLWEAFRKTHTLEGSETSLGVWSDDLSMPLTPLEGALVYVGQAEPAALLLAVDVSASALRGGHLEFAVQQILLLLKSLSRWDKPNTPTVQHL